MTSSQETSLSRDIYSHLVRYPSGKTFCLAVITGVVQALLLLCVGIDYTTKWSSRWLAIAAGSMLSADPKMLMGLALCKVASLAALLYYVHSEALSAVALLRLVTQSSAAYADADVSCSRMYSPFLVLVPLWQLLLAVGTLSLQSFVFVGYYLPAGYGSYTINQDGALITEVISAAVALSFVLDLDNKAIEMLRLAPETFSMASMYSATFPYSSKTAGHLLPQASGRHNSSTNERYAGLLSHLCLHFCRVKLGLNAPRLARVFAGCVVGVFHVVIMLYASFSLNLLVDFSFDAYPTMVPALSDIVRIIAVVSLAVVVFILFQLVLGIWLPPLRKSTAACEAACSRDGRPYIPSRCCVCRWYAVASNIVLPLITSAVNLVGHHVGNLEGHKVLVGSGVDCDSLVSLQLQYTGGANISCGNQDVNMVQYVVDKVASNNDTTGMRSFPLCNMFGVRDFYKCTFLWYVALPIGAWVIGALLLVLLPQVVAIRRQQPCRLCSCHESTISSDCDCSTLAVAKSDSAFASKNTRVFDQCKSV